MTVCYNAEVATSRPFGFVRLLFKWRGSFYKLIAHQFLIYFLIYTSLNFLYGFALNDAERKAFDQVGAVLGEVSSIVVSSLALCLNFFMSQVYKRFWENFKQIPWPDSFAFYTTCYVVGSDKQGKLLRRTMVRYAVASIVLSMMCCSQRIGQLFPDLDYLAVAGFLTENEVKLLKPVPPNARYLAVLAWDAALVKRAKTTENRIEDEYGSNAIIDELDRIRQNCRRLMMYNSTPVPLAYLHVVVLAVYSFFTTAAVAGSHRSQTDELHEELLTDAPIGELWTIRLLSEVVTLLQFAICAGMLAATESLICPFGNADGHFETDTIIKRHLGTSYLIVDELFALIPQLSKEDQSKDADLFHTSHHHLMRLSSHTGPGSRRGSVTRSSNTLNEQEGLEMLYRLSAGDFLDDDDNKTSRFEKLRQRFLRWLRRIPNVRSFFRFGVRRPSIFIHPSDAGGELTGVVIDKPSVPSLSGKASIKGKSATLPTRSPTTPPILLRLLSFRRMN